MGMAYLTGGQTKLQLELWIGNIMKCCVHWNSVHRRKDFSSCGNRNTDRYVHKPSLNPSILRALGIRKSSPIRFCTQYMLCTFFLCKMCYVRYSNCTAATAPEGDIYPSVGPLKILWLLQFLSYFHEILQNTVITTIWWIYIYIMSG